MTHKRVATDLIDHFHYVDVLGSRIHYIEQGQGNPILFLHGIPASSYVWRNVLPHLATLGRCIAPDLIGMGKSDKPEIGYGIFEHIKYIETFIEALGLKRITLVVHGWGSLIGFHYAMRHEANCRGIAFYESYLRPFHSDDISLPYQEQLQDLQENTSNFTMNGIYFIDKILSQSMMGKLSRDEMAHYYMPFLAEGTGKPFHQYVKELPRADGKTKVDQLIAEYSKKLTQSKLPKLMLYSIPGFITTIETIVWAKNNLPYLELIEIGEDLHYAQESNPHVMGEAISVWLQAIEQAR